MRSRIQSLAGVLLLSSGLAACGGSGGSSSGRSAGETLAASSSAASSGSGGASSASAASGGGAGGEAAFTQTVYPIVRQYCQSCHSGGGPGFPDIAHPDSGTAYRVTVDNQKVSLTNPGSSRLVLRLFPDRHHCWSANCSADAAAMQAAIQQWADMTINDPNNASGPNGQATASSDEVISSYSNVMGNAQAVASTRSNMAPIALFEFEEDEGTVAHDTSGVPPLIDLQLSGFEWISGGGVEIQTGRALASAEDSIKLFNMIASGSGSQRYSIEAWVVPANTDQEAARIVAYSDGSRRNFDLRQEMYNYSFRNRSLATGVDSDGAPTLETADADEDLQAVLQHVVVTFDPSNGRRIYVNGEFTGDMDEQLEGLSAPAPLATWNSAYRLVLGNEISGNRLFAGQFKLVAIYNRVLSEAQILQNYLAGASDQFTLRFGLNEWLDAGTYIQFTVNEFDAFSYIFCEPTIVGPNPNGYSVERLRISVNGVAPVASQSFRNITSSVDEPSERLADLCSVVPKDRGPRDDVFAIWFDRLGTNERRMVETPPEIVPDTSVAEALPNSGIRNFDQVNSTMSAVTGVPTTAGAVSAAFQELEQQLPSNMDVRSFVSSQQVAISKLALEYCDLLVDSMGLRQAFFGTQFQFGSNVVTAFADQSQIDMIIDPLVDKMIGTSLASQPARAEIAPVLDELIGTLTEGCDSSNCDEERTRTVVKGACAAVLSSAAVHIQ